MRRAFRTVLMVGLLALGVYVLAQESQRPESRRSESPRPEERGRGPQPSPVMAALDANRDGEISADEIEKAADALRSIDRNKDGKLSADETRPTFGGFGGGRGEAGGFGGRGDGGERRGGFDGGFNREQMAERMLREWDANEDGKLSKDEIPERMREFLTRSDADEDGVLTKDELLKGGPPQREGGREGGFGGRPGGFGGGAGGFGGRPNPEAFVERALEFDADKDGKLSKEELGKMGEQFGRGFGDGRGRGDNRPERPARPE